MMNHDIFISYSSKQKSIADGVCHYLEENGFKCWMAPRDITVGSEYGDLIEEAIKSCRVVVLVFSKAASISKWVKGEINVAFTEDKPILPFRIDETEIKGSFRVMLNQMHWIDAFPQYADRLPDLLNSVCGFLGRQPHKVFDDNERLEAERKAKEEPERARLERERLERIEAEHKAEEAKRKAEQERLERERAEAQHKAQQREAANLTDPSVNAKPKPKKGLWIGIGAVVVVVLVLLLAWPKKPKPMIDDQEEKAYQACQTIDDYRSYLYEYGSNSLHYADANAFIEQYLADSTAKAQPELAELQAQQQAEAELTSKAETEKEEDDAYKKCTTIAACNNYLKAYPKGRYVVEVKAKKTELEAKAKASQQSTNSASGSYNGHEYVDLGLPSGTLWAICNVGANKPEDYGNYYAWGETSTKNTYIWATYKYANGGCKKLTKYCSDSEYGNNGFIDNLTELQEGDDPATANWGNGWRTPSKAQWKELENRTTKQWTTRNGVKGKLFTSKKNGQAIFLPAAGLRGRGDNLRDSDTLGFYWSRSLNADYPYYASYLLFSSDNGYMSTNPYRSFGYAVRPVRQK